MNLFDTLWFLCRASRSLFNSIEMMSMAIMLRSFSFTRNILPFLPCQCITEFLGRHLLSFLFFFSCNKYHYYSKAQVRHEFFWTSCPNLLQKISFPAHSANSVPIFKIISLSGILLSVHSCACLCRERVVFFC